MEGWNGWGVPVYRHVLARVGLDEGGSVLDVGCGAGRFARIAADHGAQVCGLDATAAFVEIARERVLGGEFKVGEMEELPWPDDSFDLVTGFNSFFIASDMAKALGEARRVARPGSPVAMTVFGHPEHCDSTQAFASLGQLMPSKPSDEREPEDQEEEKPPALHEEGVLEGIAAEAGLTLRESDYLSFVEEYADLQTILRGMMAAPPFRRASRMAGEEKVRKALGDALKPFEKSTGRYRLQEEVRFLIAEA
jgi:SAM-dependent methyltransferase